MRQSSQIGSTACRPHARTIAIKAEHRLRRHAPQQFQLVFGERRAERRHSILDARLESFELRLEPEAAGRTLVIRATDALGNVGTGQVQIR